mmetsp:Transcript_38426/g.105846  ORF Transcript_38426/g.105846 Transcript_38426/m.105846 type:complete len:292 (-) Transcript_38426:7-882(-)
MSVCGRKCTSLISLPSLTCSSRPATTRSKGTGPGAKHRNHSRLSTQRSRYAESKRVTGSRTMAALVTFEPALRRAAMSDTLCAFLKRVLIPLFTPNKSKPDLMGLWMSVLSQVFQWGFPATRSNNCFQLVQPFFGNAQNTNRLERIQISSLHDCHSSNFPGTPRLTRSGTLSSRQSPCVQQQSKKWLPSFPATPRRPSGDWPGQLHVLVHAQLASLHSGWPRNDFSAFTTRSGDDFSTRSAPAKSCKTCTRRSRNNATEAVVINQDARGFHASAGERSVREWVVVSIGRRA